MNHGTGGPSASRPRAEQVGPSGSADAKPAFDVTEALRCIGEAVQAFPQAALFELADEGFASAFEQLVACIISIRTRDETTLMAARRLFGIARTPAAIAALDTRTLDQASMRAPLSRIAFQSRWM